MLMLDESEEVTLNAVQTCVLSTFKIALFSLLLVNNLKMPSSKNQ